MLHRSTMTLAACALCGLLVSAGCDRRGDEYTSPQDRSSEIGGTADEPSTPPATTPSPPPTAAPSPPAEGGQP